MRCYDDRDSSEYQCTLIPSNMRELDLPLAPATRDKQDWLAWSRLLVPRLELTHENELRVGEPPRQANGLPHGFTLGESVQKNNGTVSHEASGGGKDEEATAASKRTSPRAGKDKRSSDMGKSRCGTSSQKLPPADPRHVTLFFKSL